MTGPAEAIEASAAAPAISTSALASSPAVPAGSPVDVPADARSTVDVPAGSPDARKKDQYKTWINKYKYNTIAAQVNDPTDPMLAKYIELKLADEDAAKEQFRDRTILIDDEPATILNPYKAAQYRGDPTITTWSSGSSFNSGEMFAADNAVVQKLVPNELLSDRRAVSAILESLWFCGTKQEIGSNPYCFPERYLGMLRKYGSKAVRFAGPEAEAPEAVVEEAEEEEEEEEAAEVEAEAPEAEAPEEAPVPATPKLDAGLLRVKAAVKAARKPPPK
jgi:hypothetical protein